MKTDEIGQQLDALVSARDVHGDWQSVLRDAQQRRPRRRLVPALAFAAALAVAAGAALLWPFGGGPEGSVLDRALAAMGDGPVVHAVLRADVRGTLVDLASDARRPVYGEREIWYDEARGLHLVVRFGDVVDTDVVLAPDELAESEAATYRVLVDDYREALATGRARVVGTGEAYGEPVYWIEIRAEQLPDSTDGKLHRWAREIGISRSTYEPVAMRETRDGTPGPGTGEQILEVETLAAADGDFASPQGGLGGDATAVKEGRDEIARSDAHEALGATPLWLGNAYRDLELARVYRTTTTTGRAEQTLLSDQDARRVRSCLAARNNGSWPDECRELGSFSARGKRVYRIERVRWDAPKTGVTFFYGALADDPSTYREDLVPKVDAPFVQLTESTAITAIHGWVRYVPPAGSILLEPDGAGRGFLRVDAVNVLITASSDELVLAAARALRPMAR